ncbi:META domain-containing protein [Sphingomonas arenae]|uniref:META domain-containing protein n=1 Tax=Sphingomonas arenae TaxID=2812555 RepID=UPI001967C14F
MTAPPPPPPPPPGDVYVALGTEPFWRLTINQQEMVFTEANAPGVQIMQPTPRVIIGIAGEIYETPRIGINIVHARCSDGMSDRVYPDKVQVRIDNRQFNGCGGEPMAPTAIENTGWSVVSVNGKPAQGGESYSVQFQNGRLSARFGCNSMAGSYHLDGLTLTAGALAMTRMACPDMTMEADAAKILSLPVQLKWDPSNRLTLSNSAGVIVLRRNY